jgi:hypothetical protein
MESEESIILREAINLLEQVAELLEEEALDGKSAPGGKIYNKIIDFLDENS